MAEKEIGGGAMILEEYLMADEELLLDKASEEDEIDLYNNLTSAYLEESEAKTLAEDPEEAPVDGFEEAGEEARHSKTAEEQPMLEDVSEDENHHVESQLAYEAEEEMEEKIDMAEQEEDHTSEGAEEQDNLGDPAVMKAVRGQSALEREDSAGRIASSLIDYTADYLACYLDSSGRTLKSSSQRFMRPHSPMVPGSVRSPYPFTPPRRTWREFTRNQTLGYASPSFRSYVSSPTWPVTHSPDPLLFSPSASSPQKFKFGRHGLPRAMTQLHPLHQRILTQKQQQRGERRTPCMEPPPPETDPSVGLMTSLEKDWVIKVQMMQLQSENPERDDYYYQEYYRRLEHKQAQKGLPGGCKHGVPKLVTPFIQKVEMYESVVRIPGSLGQVTVSTCYSPRRAIDAIQHISLGQAIRNQRLQALYQIEKLYLQLLDVEDTQRKLDLAPEELHSHFCEKLAHMVEHIYQTLRIEDSRDHEETTDGFLQFLLAGKGKKLVARLLPHLSQEQAKQILFAITQHLPFLIQKDLPDEILPLYMLNQEAMPPKYQILVQEHLKDWHGFLKTLPILYSSLGDVVEQLTFSEVVDILQELTRLQPDSVKQSLAAIFANKFAISFLYLLLSHGERCLSSSMPLEPDSGDFEKWVDTVRLVAKELSRVPKDSMVEPLYLPSNLPFLLCHYVAKGR